MEKRFLSVLGAAAMGVILPASAGIGLFDWEDTEHGCSNEWPKDGLKFSNARGAMCLAFPGALNGVGNGTVTGNDVEGLSVEHLEGKTFTPLSIDLAEYSLSVNAEGPVTFIGEKPDGTMVSFSVTLDEVRDGPGGVADFQTAIFPPEFQGLVKMVVPSRRWSFDNFKFSTLIPLPLINEPPPRSSFVATPTGVSRAYYDSLLVAGEDYHYHAGASFSERGIYLRTETNTSFIARGGSYDPESGRMVFCGPQSSHPLIRSFARGEGFRNLVSLAELQSIWPQAQSLDMPCASGERLFFRGIDYRGSEAFALFKQEDSQLLPLLLPGTLLPHPAGPAEYRSFPEHFRARGLSFAFDTSLDGRSGKHLFASFGGLPIQRLIGEGDALPGGGTISSIARLGFDSQGRVEALVKSGPGTQLLRFDAQGLVDAEGSPLIRPVNVGRTVTGSLFRSTSGDLYLDTAGEIYRKHGNDYFRVLGVGDFIDGQEITDLAFLTAREAESPHILVEVRFASLPTFFHYDLALDPEPVALPPKIGRTEVHPETGELYLTLSQLTVGREYWLLRSDNLKDWSDVREIDQVLPVQHLRIAQETLGSKSFYKVEER